MELDHRYILMDEDIPAGLLGGSKATKQLFYTLTEKAWVKTGGGFLSMDDELGCIDDARSVFSPPHIDLVLIRWLYPGVTQGAIVAVTLVVTRVVISVRV